MPNWLNPMTPFKTGINQLFPDPSRGAAEGLNQIPGTMKPYYQPYIQGGNAMMPQLQQQYGQMMSDPNAVISRMGQGYQHSPGYDWNLQQGEQGINNAAAAGGMLGSNEHQQQAGQLSHNMANQDYQQYLQNAMGMYGQGLQGGQTMANQGQQAGTDLAQSLAQALMSQSNLKYAGQANQNQQTGGLIGNVLGWLKPGGGK